LIYCINRNGGPFLWPIRLPGSDGRSNQWWDGARAAAAFAKDRWVRCWANLAMNSYDAVIATAFVPEPNWPDLSLRDLLHLAFKDRLIDRHDHPILKALRGRFRCTRSGWSISSSSPALENVPIRSAASPSR
jgi:hypothetical protein